MLTWDVGFPCAALTAREIHRKQMPSHDSLALSLLAHTFITILDLAQYKNDTTLLPLYKSKYLEITSRYEDHEALFTDRFKDEESASAAVYYSAETYSSWLPDGETIFSAELKALLLALEYMSPNLRMINLSSSWTHCLHCRHCKVMTSEIHY